MKNLGPMMLSLGAFMKSVGPLMKSLGPLMRYICTYSKTAKSINIFQYFA